MSRNDNFRRRIMTGAMAAVTLLGMLTATTAQAGQQASGPVVITPAAVGPIMATSIASATQSQFQRGRMVDFASSMEPGSMVIRTKERALYLIVGKGKAVRYSVAVGRQRFSWSGIERVSLKKQWPDWRPPEEMRKRRPELPEFMAGGPQNPLGARAIYLGNSMYRIHGTNEPDSIGKAASSGCIRMLNDDVTELYQHVKLGAMVVVM